MRATILGCLAILLFGSFVVAGCGNDVSGVVGKYSADLQGDAAQTIGATAWTFEFREDGTFEEVLVIRNTETKTIRGTFEIMDNSITMYDANKGMMEDDFTIQEDKLVDQLGGVWVKQ